MRYLISILLIIAVGCPLWAANKAPLRILIIDGQNNHAWQQTTPVLRHHLSAVAHFQVDVATSPPRGSNSATMNGFHPNLNQYDVIVSNYNGQPWGDELRQSLIDFVNHGGGFVVVHAANNAFGSWQAYNRLIGLGGWDNRTESAGPFVYYRDGRIVRDETTPGPGGSHGPQHEFQIVIRDTNHPITDGMPLAWMHAKDELYDSLRGPAEEMRILATAYSEKSGRHEPMILTVRFGNGRIFHTPMGHSVGAMKCAGFAATLQRGVEWAATSHVTLPLPADFPSASKTATRE